MSKLWKYLLWLLLVIGVWIPYLEKDYLLTIVIGIEVLIGIFLTWNIGNNSTARGEESNSSIANWDTSNPANVDSFKELRKNE